jgi:regulator of replication initiation timing
MTTIPPERVKELREWLEDVCFNDQAEVLGDIPKDLLVILDDYEEMREWKDRAEKAEAENEKLRNEQALSDKAWDIQRDKLEKAEAESDGWTEVLEDAANKHLRNLDKIARLEAELAVILDAHTAMQTELATLRCEAATLRAEREELKMMHRGTEEARYKLEAELAKQAPLIQAAVGATLYDSEAPGVTLLEFSELDEEAILRSALALREGK